MNKLNEVLKNITMYSYPQIAAKEIISAIIEDLDEIIEDLSKEGYIVDMNERISAYRILKEELQEVMETLK